MIVMSFYQFFVAKKILLNAKEVFSKKYKFFVKKLQNRCCCKNEEKQLNKQMRQKVIPKIRGFLSTFHTKIKSLITNLIENYFVLQKH